MLMTFKLQPWQKLPGRQKCYRKLPSNILSAALAQATTMITRITTQNSLVTPYVLM